MPSLSLAELQFEHFEALRGEVFLVYVDGGSAPLSFELVTVTGARRESRRPSQLRSPFSVVFRGPVTPQLLQRMYDLEHAKIGRHGIFIVPIRKDEKGVYYEAVFA